MTNINFTDAYTFAARLRMIIRSAPNRDVKLSLHPGYLFLAIWPRTTEEASFKKNCSVSYNQRLPWKWCQRLFFNRVQVRNIRNASFFSNAILCSIVISNDLLHSRDHRASWKINGQVYRLANNVNSWWCHRIETVPRYWPFKLCVEFTGQRWIPRTKASDAELWCFLWSAPE